MPLEWMPVGQRPTEEGWYWWRIHGDGKINMVELFEVDPSDGLWAWGTRACIAVVRLKDFGVSQAEYGQWAGPIHPPAMEEQDDAE